MQHTIAAVYNQQTQAQRAMEDVVASGIPRDDVHLSQNEGSQAQRGAEDKDEGAFAGIRSFFAEVFGSDRGQDDAALYSEAVRRGNYVLTVNVPEDDLVDRTTDVLDRYDPVDIEEQASQWKSGGWAAPQSMRQDSAKTDEARAQTGSQAMPMAPEELEAGKRQMQRGGVRIYQRAAERPMDARGAESEMENLPGQSAKPGGQADDDSYFRSHWQNNYASSGTRYEDYAPAYQYGSRMAASDTYKGKRWDDVESDVRRDWESRNPGTAWQKFKVAIRHGWQKMTG